MSKSLQPPMICSRRVTSNCPRLIVWRDRMASKSYWDVGKSWLECMSNLVISPCITSVCKKLISPHNSLKKGVVCHKQITVTAKYKSQHINLSWQKRVNCSRILWCIWTSRKRWASDLFRLQIKPLSKFFFVGATRLQEKGLQSKSMTARLFIK